MTPGANVLVAVSRITQPHHPAARAWIKSVLAADESGADFTSRPIADAADFKNAILALPGVRLAPLGPDWPKLRQLCLDKQLGAN